MSIYVYNLPFSHTKFQYLYGALVLLFVQLTIVLFCTISIVVNAQQVFAQTQSSLTAKKIPLISSDKNIRATEHTEHQLKPWQQWDLTQTDWQRYSVLMAGPRGYWSAQLDPLTALGVHASNDEERERYATILLSLEQQRIAGEIAFQRVYNRLAKNYQPHLPVLLKPLGLSRQIQHIVMFTPVDCGQNCNLLLQRLSDELNHIRQLDIYLVDATSPELLKNWQGLQKLPQPLPSHLHIVIRAGKRLLDKSRYGLTMLPPLPFLLAQKDGTWEVVQ